MCGVLEVGVGFVVLLAWRGEGGGESTLRASKELGKNPCSGWRRAKARRRGYRVAEALGFVPQNNATSQGLTTALRQV